MNITAVCEALATALAPLEPDVKVHAYVPASPNPPCVIVDVGPTVPQATMGRRGFVEREFTVWGIVPLAGDVQTAQQRLHRWLAEQGAESIKALLEADVTLGGAGHLSYEGDSGTRRYTAGGGATSFLGAEWTVTVRGGA